MRYDKVAHRGIFTSTIKKGMKKVDCYNKIVVKDWIENVLPAYFMEMSTKVKALWSVYSVLKIYRSSVFQKIVWMRQIKIARNLPQSELERLPSMSILLPVKIMIRHLNRKTTAELIGIISLSLNSLIDLMGAKFSTKIFSKWIYKSSLSPRYYGRYKDKPDPQI